VNELDPDLRRSALTFASRLRKIKDDYVERDIAVDVVALAALCREHVLLIGPPGTAKTAVLEQFSGMLRARYFSYLLTKFTEPAELFGAIDVRRFQEQKELRVNTHGMLPEAEIVFLDEVFNGSSAILNTLLALVNERRFRNGSRLQRAHLITLLGASNDVPDDPMLSAFCDRFLFRCAVEYVSEEAVDDVLDLGWVHEQRWLDMPDLPAVDEEEDDEEDDEAWARPDTAQFSLDDLRAMQRAIFTIDLGPVRRSLVTVLQTLQDEKISFSDRRAVKAQKAIAASALLDGRGRAEPADLAVLTHLWSVPHDEIVIRRVLEANEVPLPSQQARVPDINEVRYQLRAIGGQIPIVESGEELREINRRLGRWLADVRAFYPDQAEVLQTIGQLQRLALEKLRDTFGE
jgi:MoxR-like ATPase